MVISLESKKEQLVIRAALNISLRHSGGLKEFDLLNVLLTKMRKESKT